MDGTQSAVIGEIKQVRTRTIKNVTALSHEKINGSLPKLAAAYYKPKRTWTVVPGS
ncbi:hypothetical protein GCM10023310_32190 [Paenibacillus vulneris]